MELLAKNYKLRSDLESVVLAECGSDIDKNREVGHTIKGTAEELKALYLSDLTTIFGVRCICTDESTVKLVEEKNKRK